MSGGLAQSVQVRLVRHAKAANLDPNLVLTRYATERFLYRLAQSPHGDRFVLKGALLMLVWLGENIRPTRDADLLGSGEMDAPSLERIVAELCQITVEPDGIEFDATTIRVADIRADDPYGGMRATLLAHLGKARAHLQIDVGIGDAVTPPPEWLDYPSLLGFPRPRLRAYRQETAIAEKVHAMVVLGAQNSRMKDFFDVHTLAMRESFEAEILRQALVATFERRSTPVPFDLPLALTPAFAAVEGKVKQWAGFLDRNRIETATKNLEVILLGLASFIGPVLRAGARGESIPARWLPGGPWRSDS